MQRPMPQACIITAMPVRRFSISAQCFVRRGIIVLSEACGTSLLGYPRDFRRFGKGYLKHRLIQS